MDTANGLSINISTMMESPRRDVDNHYGDDDGDDGDNNIDDGIF